MEKYSLLKLRPTLTQTLNLSLKNRPSILRDSLYSVLNGAADGAEGQCVRVFDGQMTRDYRVIKYERYKAGLMGRAWLLRQDRSDDDGKKGGDLVRDEDALGLKWKIVAGRQS